MNEYKSDLVTDLKSLRYSAKYLGAAIADSVEAFLIALRDVAEAQKGMTNLACEAGLNRENLYRAFSEQGNPRLRNLKAVLDSIGLQIEFKPGGGALRRRTSERSQSKSRRPAAKRRG
jgi:probable addiction module antidote protein